MSRTIVLDARPLGLVTNPHRSPQSMACTQWLQEVIRAGAQVFVPESADYEVRRELLRANKTSGIARLDALAARLHYLPLTTAAIRQAALFWAQARQHGYPTANDKALDGDAILSAQAVTLGLANTIIATTNVAHVSRFAPAEVWQNIRG